MLHREYAPIPELDAYGSEGVDDEDYDNITAEQRARAEKEISRREKQEALASGRLRPGLLYGRLRQTDRQTLKKYNFCSGMCAPQVFMLCMKCVCVRACVRVCVCVRAHVCMCVLCV